MAAFAAAAPRTLLLLLALALGLGAAFSSAVPSASRPSVAAAGSSSASRDVPHRGAAARLQRAPAIVLDLPAALVPRHVVVALAIAPARRHLLAYPAESPEAHGAGDPAGASAPAAPPAGANDEGAGRVLPLPPSAPSTSTSCSGAGAAEAEIPRDPLGFVVRNVAGYTNTTEPSLNAPAERSILALPAASPGPADDPARRPAAPPAAAEQGRDSCEGPLPPHAACTFVTYAGCGGPGAGALEFAPIGRERVFVIREHASAGNITGADATAPKQSGCAWSSPPEDDYSDPESESDCDGDDGDDDFTQAMEQFCTVLGHAVMAMDAFPWSVGSWCGSGSCF